MMRIISSIFLRRTTSALSNLLTRTLSMETGVKRVAVCQMTSTHDKKANLEVVSMLIQQASKENVQMLFFPEACDYLCDNKRDTVEFAESILDGATVDSYRNLAAKHQVWLSMGGLHEKDPAGSNKIYNTHVIIDNTGAIVQTYRKLHLFDVELPEKGIRLVESDTALAGQHIVTPVKTAVGNIGLAICYDLRFPELGPQLAGMGSDILTYPSAFTHATGQAHWETLLRARAIENQCYVIAAAQYGAHNPKRRSYGYAACVDPWGVVIASCEERSPGYACAEIDIRRLRKIRDEMPVFKHRRSDVYSLCSLSLCAAPLPEHCVPLPAPQDTLSPPSVTLPTPAQPRAGPLLQFGQVTVPESCVFLRTEFTFAFVNLRCVVPGHVLVAPLEVVKRNEDLTPQQATDFFATIIAVQKLMERVHNVKSSTINIQDGPDAGQTIWHLHCHVMPRRPKDFRDSDLIYLELAKHDRLTPCSPTKPARSLQEMESEAALLRKELEIMKNKSAL